ncbi:MAG: hypothetical protein RR247_02625 [Clostridia bacterium]
MEKKTNLGKVMVERETFEKDGKSYFSYFIKGVVRGKEVRILVSPPDKGGFTVLDIVFGSEMKAELITKPYEIKDEKTGNVIKGNSYAVHSVDENGDVYESTIKPFRSSDKALLNMLTR